MTLILRLKLSKSDKNWLQAHTRAESNFFCRRSAHTEELIGRLSILGTTRHDVTAIEIPVPLNDWDADLSDVIVVDEDYEWTPR